MATRFIDKEHGTDTSTAIADDATGTAKVRNLPDAVGFVYDRVDGFFKYNDGGTIRTVVNTNEAQTLTAKILNGSVGTLATEVVSATNVITAAESGTTFFLNSATEFASTLPAPAAGVNYTFIVTAAPSGASYTVVTEGGCQILAGHVITSGFADSGSDVETAATGTTVTFVDGVSVVGDRAYVVSDGSSWFVSAITAVEAGITITG